MLCVFERGDSDVKRGLPVHVAGGAGRIALLLGSLAVPVLAGQILSAPLANAQFFEGGFGGPPPNRWVYGSRGSYYVPGGVIYGEPGRARWRGGDTLKTKAHNDLKKAAVPPPVKGPLLITISIADQRLTLYDNGVPVAHSPVSTGTVSHPTPTGVFSVIQKARFHRSNLYSSAPMPFMQRITWSGVALHAGHLPGYPASHGCIRLPYEFAIRMFKTTKLGARVIISRQEVAPTEISHAKLFVPKAKDPVVAPASPAKEEAKNSEDKTIAAEKPNVTAVPQAKNSEVETAKRSETAPPATAPKDEPKAPTSAGPTSVGAAETRSTAGESRTAEPAKAEPAPSLKIAELRPAVSSDAPSAVPERPLRPGPISVFVSGKEKRVFVRKGFEPVFEAPVEIADADRPLGTHVFTAMALGEEGAPAHWTVVTMPPERVKAKRIERERRGRRADRSRVAEVAVADVQSVTASEALDRITIPQDAMNRISKLMSVGASLIISDKGLGPETGLETDFVVLTR